MLKVIMTKVTKLDLLICAVSLIRSRFGKFLTCLYSRPRAGPGTPGPPRSG